MITRNRLKSWSVLFICLGWAAPAFAAEVKTLEIGQAAPEFRLPGVDGKQHRLEDFADARLLVVVFTCNHCPTAQAYEQRIQQLADEYRGKGVALVAISPNDPLAVRLDELGYTDLSDSLEEMKQRAKDQGFTFPYLYDGDRQEVSKAYGPVATPHVFIFDQDRRLRYTGRIDDSAKPENVTSRDARAAIDALLAGRAVPVAKTRTFGCSIKWSDKRESARESMRRWDQEQATLDTITPQEVKKLVANDSDKYRLINVWATWCGPCVAEFPELVTMHRMYRKRDFELITISADALENRSKVEKFLNEQHASCKNYLFNGKNEYELVESLDPKWQGALPYTLLIAPGGKILYRKQDAFDARELKKAISDHLGRVYK
ncbi:MAG: redoxin domain-containing protein [Planctomycetes bacterium]|nr:redoxin domain-containing protein [Planctomycetota bacterium]